MPTLNQWSVDKKFERPGWLLLQRLLRHNWPTLELGERERRKAVRDPLIKTPSSRIPEVGCSYFKRTDHSILRTWRSTRRKKGTDVLLDRKSTPRLAPFAAGPGFEVIAMNFWSKDLENTKRISIFCLFSMFVALAINFPLFFRYSFVINRIY